MVPTRFYLYTIHIHLKLHSFFTAINISIGLNQVITKFDVLVLVVWNNMRWHFLGRRLTLTEHRLKSIIHGHYSYIFAANGKNSDF